MARGGPVRQLNASKPGSHPISTKRSRERRGRKTRGDSNDDVDKDGLPATQLLPLCLLPRHVAVGPAPDDAAAGAGAAGAAAGEAGMFDTMCTTYREGHKEK